MIKSSEFITYLSAKLNGTGEFSVVEERELKYNDTKVNAILNLQVGTYFEDTFEQPFMIDFFTDSPKETMALVQQFVSENVNQRWVNGDYTIINAMQMPYFGDKNITGLSTNTGAQIIVLGSFMAVKNPLDIISITINDDTFIPINFQIVGTTQEDTATEYVSGSLYKYTSTNSFVNTNIHVVVYSYNNDVSKIFREILFGKVDPNTIFSVKFNFVGGDTEEIQSIVINPALSKQQYTELSKWDLTFLIASNTLS